MTLPVPTVTAGRLGELMRQGAKVPLVDVRTPQEYAAAHVADSILLPLDELTPATLSERGDRPGLGRDHTVYLTCQSGPRSRRAAERLMAAGYSNLAMVEGGLNAWERAGLPMERCTNAISLERQVQIAVGGLLMVKVLFGFTVHEGFFVTTALLGLALVFAGVTRWCGMARLLARMPWNRVPRCGDRASAEAGS